jgi:IS30 family transposase
LNKSESVISREIRNNSIKKKGTNKKEYLAIDAEHKAYLRRW